MASARSRTIAIDNEDDVIPESILSLSKDARYIRQCQELLQNALTALLEQKESLVPSEPGGPERQRELQQVRTKLTWLFSVTLYLLVSIRTGRTLGMEALGLTFSDESFAKSVKAKLTTLTKARLGRSIFASVLLMSAATGGLAWEYFTITNSTETPNNSSNNNDGDDWDSQQQHQNQERLRGSERRLMHERLRRQMLERAANTTTTSATPMREQPSRMEREIAQINGNITGSSSASTTGPSTSPSKRVLFMFRQLSKFIFHVYSNSDGPHDIVQTSISTDDDDESNGNDRTSASYSIALWIVRLHLAQFLLTGNYPTLMHRFFGLKLRREHNTTKSTATILSRPNTNRVIGLVILLQAATSLVQNTSNWFTRTMANYLEVRAHARTQNGDHRNNARATKIELQKKLEAFFGNQLGGEQLNGAKLRTMNRSSSQDSERTQKRATAMCSICRSDREHPAAPSSCGHVFCWNCLIQWVSTVRPECPLCRAPCSAKDVIALHNYKPELKQENHHPRQ